MRAPCAARCNVLFSMMPSIVGRPYNQWWSNYMAEEITRRALPFVDAAPEEACLVVIYGGPVLGKRYALSGETTIGRDPGTTIPFDLFDVSRQHARLFPCDAGWCLSDLGSM